MGEFQHFIGCSAICAGKAEIALPYSTVSINQHPKAGAIGASARVGCAFSIFTRWGQSKHILGSASYAIGIRSTRRPVVVICDPCRAIFIESNETGPQEGERNSDQTDITKIKNSIHKYCLLFAIVNFKKPFSIAPPKSIFFGLWQIPCTKLLRCYRFRRTSIPTKNGVIIMRNRV